MHKNIGENELMIPAIRTRYAATKTTDQRMLILYAYAHIKTKTQKPAEIAISMPLTYLIKVNAL